MPETQTQSLEEIVSQATKDAPAKLETDGTILLVAGGETEVETTTTESIETKEEPKTPKVDDLGLTDEEVVEARRLLAGLRDPLKAPAIVAFLAESHGFKKGDAPPTKAAEKAVVKGMVEELKEALGPELEYLADKMGPVLEKRFKDLVEETAKPIKDKIDAADLKQLEVETAAANEEIGKVYFDGEIPQELAAEMYDLIDKIKPYQGQSQKDYLEQLLFVAAGKKGVALQKTSKSKAEKILKNRNDAPSRLASEGTRQPRVGEKTDNPRRQMTLDESIRDGLAKATAELSKN